NRPAVNNHYFAIHKTIAIADHERGVLSQLFRTAEPAARSPEVVHLQPTLRQSLRQIGVKNSSGYRVNLDSEGAGLARQAFGETNHGRFRSGVVHGSWQSPDGADGSDVEDAAGALSNHLLVKGFGNGKKTAHVGVDNFVPGLVGGYRKVIAAIDGCVVDQDIHAAPFMHQFSSQMLQP